MEAKFKGYWDERRRLGRSPSPPPWKPKPMFLVGDLASPNLLKSILNLPEPPVLQAVHSTMFKISPFCNELSILTYRSAAEMSGEPPLHGFLYDIKKKEQELAIEEYILSFVKDLVEDGTIDRVYVSGGLVFVTGEEDRGTIFASSIVVR